MKIRLFSYGGSGLTFLTNAIKTFTEDACTKKHAPHVRPSASLLEFDKIIFIWADVRNAVLSLRSKNLVHVARNFDVPYFGRQYILDHDALDLKGFFKAWLNFQFKPEQLLFVKYCALKDHASDIAKFLALDNCFINHITDNFQARRHNYNDSREIKKLLERTYSELIALQENLPTLIINKLPSIQETINDEYRRKTEERT